MGIWNNWLIFISLGRYSVFGLNAREFVEILQSLPQVWSTFRLWDGDWGCLRSGSYWSWGCPTCKCFSLGTSSFKEPRISTGKSTGIIIWTLAYVLYIFEACIGVIWKPLSGTHVVICHDTLLSFEAFLSRLTFKLKTVYFCAFVFFKITF